MSPSDHNLQAQIPVIDISNDNPSAPKQLLDAAIKFGFIYIANDKGEINPDLIAQMFDLTREFFASPLEVKQSVSINSNKAGKNHGWLSQGVEKLDPATQKRPDVKE
jgi:isopenicillin N synthase-like dioxygenase